MHSKALTVPKLQHLCLSNTLESRLSFSNEFDYQKNFINNDQLISVVSNHLDTFETRQALLNVQFIAQHMENLDNYCKVSHFG